MTGHHKQTVSKIENGLGQMYGKLNNGHLHKTNGILETNSETEHFNGICSNGDTNYTNGYGSCANGTDTCLSVNGFGHTDNEDNIEHIVSLKQTNRSKQVTTESHSISEQNEEPMYDLCDRLSSVGMEDGNENHMCEQIVPPQPAFSDSVADPNEHMSIRWTQENLFKQDKDGDTYLHTAIILLQMDLAIALINTALTPRLLSIMNKLSQSPIYLAVLTNQIDVVRRLMVGGAEIVSRDRNGSTPLHVACEKGYRKNVEQLLEPVRYHETKMNTNYEIPYQKIPQDLEIANYEGKTALHVAYENGNYDIAKLLIEKRANVNARDGKTGRTVLHYACLDGRIDMVRYLLSLKECNINAKSYDDYTPFDFARINSHTEIAILLAQAGACNRDDDDSSD